MINRIIEANRAVAVVGIVGTVDKEGGVADVVLRVRVEWPDDVYSESRLVRYWITREGWQGCCGRWRH